jgi:hypothetical protein
MPMEASNTASGPIAPASEATIPRNNATSISGPIEKHCPTNCIKPTDPLPPPLLGVLVGGLEECIGFSQFLKRENGFHHSEEECRPREEEKIFPEAGNFR